LVLDYSHQRMRVNTKQLLLALGEAAQLSHKIDSMFRGHHLNATEDRAVLHPALRAPA
jgi:glucose-6-phosphate isomerase